MSKSAVASGKKLLRELTKYAQKVSREHKISFIDAVANMRDQSAVVASDLGVSSTFVTLWAETELRQAGR
jgi:hypothetical protein